MKAIKFFLVALMTTAMMFSACNKEDETNEEKYEPTSNSKYKVVKYDGLSITSPLNNEIVGIDNVTIEASKISNVKYTDDICNDTLLLNIEDCKISYQLEYGLPSSQTNCTDWQKTCIFIINGLEYNKIYDCFIRSKIETKDGVEIIVLGKKTGFLTSFMKRKFGAFKSGNDIELMWDEDVDYCTFSISNIDNTNIIENKRADHNNYLVEGLPQNKHFIIQYNLYRNTNLIEAGTYYANTISREIVSCPAAKGVTSKTDLNELGVIVPVGERKYILQSVLGDNQVTAWGEFAVEYYYQGTSYNFIELNMFMNYNKLELNDVVYKFSPLCYNFHLVTKEDIEYLKEQNDGDLFLGLSNIDVNRVSVYNEHVYIPFVDNNLIRFIDLSRNKSASVIDFPKHYYGFENIHILCAND